MNVRSNYNGQNMIDKSKLIPGVSRVRCTDGYENERSGIRTPKPGWTGTYSGRGSAFVMAASVVWDQDPHLVGGGCECAYGYLELIEEQQPTTMEQELKITKEKVLEAASKCSTAAATLKTLFPEVFEKEAFEFGANYRIGDGLLDRYPFCIGLGGAPAGLHGRCLMMANDWWEMKTQQQGHHTVITFHKKK